MLQHLKRYLFRNPLDLAMSEAAAKGKKKFLVIWNRGLGDIPLGLYALVYRMRAFVPDAQITFLTRPDLREGFALLGGVEILVNPNIRRWQEFSLDEVLAQLGHSASEFDHIFEKLDPTRWLKWQIGTLIPKLHWDPAWDVLCNRFCIKGDGPIIGVHVQTETNYNYEKNWPQEHWRTFFAQATRELGAKILLFGFQPTPGFEGEGIIDLRGRTGFIEMMSIIKNCCTHLVVPDSGVLCMTYYLDVDRPITIASLWADPQQGVLRQKVASPNPNLKHYPMIGKGKDTSRIPVEAVMECLRNENSVCHVRSF